MASKISPSPLQSSARLSTGVTKGRSLLAEKALHAGDAVILADSPLCIVPALGGSNKAARTCGSCLCFLGDAESQLRELLAPVKGPTLCGEASCQRAHCSWLALPPEGAAVLDCACAKRIGAELVLLAAATMERTGPAALEGQLSEFHSAPYDARGAGPACATSATDVHECFAVLAGCWPRVTGAVLAWSRAQFSTLLGLLAMNAVEVKVPHPLVFQLNELAQSDSPADRLRLAGLAPLLEQLAQRHAAERVRSEEQHASGESDGEAEGETEGEGEGEDASEGEGEEGSGSSSDGDESFDLALPCAGAGGQARELLLPSAALPPSRGVALYPHVALLNHSCAPNCEVVWAHPSLALASVVTTRGVEAGEELSISYVDARLGTRERRGALERRYGFRCDCGRCAAEASPVLAARRGEPPPLQGLIAGPADGAVRRCGKRAAAAARGAPAPAAEANMKKQHRLASSK